MKMGQPLDPPPGEKLGVRQSFVTGGSAGDTIACGTEKRAGQKGQGSHLNGLLSKSFMSAVFQEIRGERFEQQSVNFQHLFFNQGRFAPQFAAPAHP
jgi:hypothetical protein